MSQQELSSLIDIIERTTPKVAAQAKIEQQGLMVELSIASLCKTHLNLSFNLSSHSDQLELNQLRLGDLPLPSGLTLTVLDWLTHRITGVKLISQISQVRVVNNQLIVHYRPPRNRQELIQSLTKFATMFGSQHTIDNDLELTQNYYQQLITLQAKSRVRRPLSYFIENLFKQAHKQSQGNENAVAHNRAAIFALGVYFGSYRFEYFIGSFAKRQLKNPRHYYLPTLAKRHDLTKHFIYSAVIELLSSTDTSEFVGELKELLDSNINGSGFSFVDLMADRAGVRFSQLATQNESSARAMQVILVKHIGNNALLPSIDSLPEGLSKHQFEQAFRNIDAPRYQALIQDIDGRLALLPIYQENDVN